MSQQQDAEQQAKEREDRPGPGLTVVCPYTISPIDGSARLCLQGRCMGYVSFDRANPEIGGFCARCLRGWVD